VLEHSTAFEPIASRAGGVAGFRLRGAGSPLAASPEPGPVTVSGGGCRRFEVQPWPAKAPQC